LTKTKKFKELDIENFKKVYNDVETYRTVQDVVRAFGISERTARSRTNAYKQDGHDLIDRSKHGKYRPKDISVLEERTAKENELLKKINSLKDELQRMRDENKELKKSPPMNFEERTEVKKLKDNISQLQKDLREVEKQALTSNHLSEMIHGMKEHSFGGVPEWLKQKKGSDKTHGIPCLFLSDIHFDEYVDPAQVGFVNEFSREIATKRIQHTFNTSIDILFNRTKNPSYDGMIIALGGDMLSGNIHEELAETNEDAIQRSLLALTDLLIDGIELHLKHFKKIFIPCVVGNHGRHHKKKRMKNKVFDNYEWLIY